MANKGTKEKLDIELEAPADPTSPGVLYQDPINTIHKHHPSDDVAMIEKACRITDEAYKEQKRKSGEPYIIHPFCVAIILADLEMDKETIVARLLHDVVEDIIMTLEQLIKELGSEVSFLMGGVTKLTQLNWDKDKVKIQADNLRKIFLAMAKDVHIVIIKLADRLHNMRTGQYWKPEKQKERARETMEIYAPIAGGLGISKVKIELDDPSLKFLQSDVYYDLVEKVALRRDIGKAFVQEIVDGVRSHMEDAGVEATAGGRVEHFFSIYEKMVNQSKTLDQVCDLFVVRIMVETVKNCYAVLGIIHEMYKLIPGRFKDYIAMPKQNMYQSLHTVLIGSNGQPFEIQIRTYEMYGTVEYGITTHWRYKESGSRQVAAGSAEAKLSWLRQTPEWQRDTGDPKEPLSMIEEDLDLFPDSTYRFTPSGDVKTLSSNSTPIDSAYCIHSAVGNKMVGARVNDKLMPIEYVIQNGDQLEIITSQSSKGPSRGWLDTMKNTRAESKINQWFKSQMKGDNIVRGRGQIERCCKVRDINWSEIGRSEFTEKVTNRYAYRDWDSVLASIGHGGLKGGQVIDKMLEKREKKLKRGITNTDVLSGIADTAGRSSEASVRKSRGGVMVKEIHNLAVRFSKCCDPVSGGEIVGFATRDRDVPIHRIGCVNIINLSEDERSRVIDVEWQTAERAGSSEQYSTKIKISTNNRIDMLADVSKVFTEKQIDITSMNARTSRQGKATVIMASDIYGADELNRLIDKIRQIEGVPNIERTTEQL